MTPQVRRSRAEQATLDRFSGALLKYGTNDCVRLIAFAYLKNTGRSIRALKGVKWRSEASGVEVMKSLGASNLIEFMDALGLARIAPAEAWRADFLALPCAPSLPWGAGLGMLCTNRDVLAFIEPGVCARFEPAADAQWLAAWRNG